MKRQKPWTGEPDGESRCGFFLVIDGQEYGPFLDKDREQYKKLQRSLNVKFRDVCLRDGWVSALVIPKRKNMQSTPLLDGLAPRHGEES